MRHAKPFVAPKVTVVTVAPGKDFDTVAIAGSLEPYKAPLAPAGLYDAGTQREEATQLHKLVLSAADVHTFRTYPPHRASPALIGQRFVYRPWWTPPQLELVTDTSLAWQRMPFPADDDHEHCALTWKAISSPTKAYCCGDTWITTEAYEQFIRDDIFHSREV